MAQPSLPMPSNVRTAEPGQGRERAERADRAARELVRGELSRTAEAPATALGSAQALRQLADDYGRAQRRETLEPAPAAVAGAVGWSAPAASPWFAKEALAKAGEGESAREDHDALWTLLNSPGAQQGWRSVEELLPGLAQAGSRWSWMAQPQAQARLAALARSHPELALALVKSIPAELQNLAAEAFTHPGFLERFAAEVPPSTAQQLAPHPAETPEVSLQLARKGRPLPQALHGEQAMLLEAARSGVPLHTLGPKAADHRETVAAAVEHDPFDLAAASKTHQADPELQARAQALILEGRGTLTAERFKGLPAPMRAKKLAAALAPVEPDVLQHVRAPTRNAKDVQDALAAALAQGRVRPERAQAAWEQLSEERRWTPEVLTGLTRSAPFAYFALATSERLPADPALRKALALTYLASYETRDATTLGEGEWLPLYPVPDALKVEPEVADFALSRDVRNFQLLPEAMRHGPLGGTAELNALRERERAGTLDAAGVATLAEARACLRRAGEVVEQDGLQLEHAGPLAQDDLATVATAVRENGLALQFASERLRANPELIRAAIIAARPHGELADQVVDVAAAVPDTFEGKQVMKGLGTVARGARNGTPLETLAKQVPEWSRDVEALTQVLRFYPPERVYAALPEGARPVFLEAAGNLLRQDNSSVAALWDGLSKALPPEALAPLARVAAENPQFYEPSVRLAAAPPRPDAAQVRTLLSSLRDEALLPLARSNRALFLEDPQLRASAVLRNADVGLYLARAEGSPPSVERWDLLVEAAEVNPLTLASLGPWNRELLLQHASELGVREKLEKGYGELQRKLQELDIEFPERLGRNWWLTSELLANRLSGDSNDPRKLAVVVGPKQDWSGALGNNDMETLARHYRVIYLESGLDRDLMKRVRGATRNQPAELVVFMGHADRNRQALGTDDPARTFSPSGESDRTLDVYDSDLLNAANIREAVAPGGHVVFVACSVGRGGPRARNLENVVAGAIPHAHVWGGRTLVLPPYFVLDKDGRLINVDYRNRPSLTMHKQPRV